MCEWISVETALPKADGAYLVVEDVSGFRVVTIRSFAKKFKAAWPGGHTLKGLRNIWFDLDLEYGEYYEINWVTHWMPIPKLPEEVLR